MTSAYREIDKETVELLVFPEADVLEDKQAQIQRLRELERALALGNLERVKVKIYFEDDKEQLMVHTTVWGVTKESVILKKSALIPHHRIHSVV